MAQKLPEAERRRLHTDFDPPDGPPARPAPPLTDGRRIRVTASLTPEEYALLRSLANQRGQSLSRTLAAALAALAALQADPGKDAPNTNLR